MAFDNLAARLQETMKKLRGKGRLSEKDVDEALREVRLALLEADVNYKVVRDFVKRVKERAVGEEVLSSLTPGQQVIKIVNDELTTLMGGTVAKLQLASRPPSIIMMVGLQGAGKTTTAAKLARLLKGQGHRPLLVAADIYRPAAIKQLMVLGEQIEVPVFSMGEQNPVDIAKAAVSHAGAHSNDVIIIDTAGRLHVDEALMEELVQIREAVSPHEILLVVDSMTGQDAVNVAETFNSRLDIGGVVLTKLDGDARGGAALSVKAVTGKPIKFAGVSEKMDGLEPFHPDRMASRILGMGDVLTLIEKAVSTVDEEKAKQLAHKLKEAEFTLEDFLEQLEQLKRMGPLDQILGMLPGMGGMKQLKNLDVDESHLKRIEAIINSMTPEERRNPQIIGGSRRRRIAQGSGTRVQEVNRLLKQFEQTRQLMKQLTGGEKSRRKSKGLFSLFR
ncbi:MAG TPA: signal recognition particle protein [Firmicutes bacterium]|jgi:signal recognition particle subunit SRP54|nr:signal recognition particle protein [Bacillota bacterium]